MFKQKERNYLKGSFMIKFILIVLLSFCGQAEAKIIEGTFSAKNHEMTCRGRWEHPFLPMNRNYGGRIPSSPLLATEASTVSITHHSLGVKISTKSINETVETISSFKGLRKGIRVYQKDDSIILRQFDLLEVHLDYGYYVGLISNIRFKAVLQLNENDDLVIENFFGHGDKKMEKMISCVLPRIL
jgi:hypothetical protein